MRTPHDIAERFCDSAGCGAGHQDCSLERAIMMLCGEHEREADRACAEIRVYRQALWEIVSEVKARAWLKDGRGPYEWNDDDYRREAGWCMDAVRQHAENALLAHERGRKEATPGATVAEIKGLECAERLLLAEERRLHNQGECPHVGQRPACWRGADLIRVEIERRKEVNPHEGR